MNKRRKPLQGCKTEFLNRILNLSIDELLYSR
jgi:hypothetical protein